MAKGGASRFFVWVILLLLIVGLAGFGATNFGGGIRSVGTVGDTEIDLDRYARELQQELRALSAQTGRSVTLTEAQGLGVPQAVLSRMVRLTALEDEAAELGISVGDEVVSEQVLAISAFQGVDGEFDRDAYRFVLEQTGLSVAEFEERVRVETAASVVQNAVASGTVFPPAYTDTIYAYAREARDATWARLSPDDLRGEIPEPTQAQLAEFHEENAERFTLPETRAITYAWVTPDMLLDTIEPDEDALRAIYEDRIDEYVQPEQRLVERLVFSTESAATEALDRIRDGEITFDALVEARGLTLDDIDLGDVARDELGEAGEAVFATDEPGIVGPAPSTLGPALFRVIAILAPRDIPFEEARDELLPEVQADRARRIIQNSLEDYDDLLAGGATLEDLAAETEMELGRIEWNPEVSEGIAAFQDFRDAAAAAQEGDFPEILEIEEGGVFALRVDEVRPPSLPPLEAVRDEVAEAWREQAIADRLTEQAESLAEEVRQGREMASLPAEFGTDRDLTRETFVDGTPEAFVPALFEMEPGEIRVVADETGAWIVRLDAVTPADQDSAEAQALKPLFAQQAAQGAADDVLDAFTRALTLDKGIEINQSAINAVHAQFP